uniref:Uncharacterized protein n=1 Tax=Vespula pensylvanica TaxID=30213 RepID=A0A834U925_VESPE|nr:hypothetical protein H0235_008391 [Vespula pensylvanica]
MKGPRFRVPLASKDRMTANGNSPLDSMRTLEHYLSDIMRAGAADTPEHLKDADGIPRSGIQRISRILAVRLESTRLLARARRGTLQLLKRIPTSGRSSCYTQTICWSIVRNVGRVRRFHKRITLPWYSGGQSRDVIEAETNNVAGAAKVQRKGCFLEIDIQLWQ